MSRRYVTGFNGSRDWYEAPLALQEAGMLARHVSDFFVPDFAAGLIKPSDTGFRSRRRAGLPSAKVVMSLEALARQTPLLRRADGAGPHVHLPLDRAISKLAATVAEREDADLFLHQYYAYWAFAAARKSRRRILFQFHPHPAYIYDALAQDIQRFPAMAWSFANDVDASPPTEQPQARLDEWRLADAIICSSSFVKASLVAQGADGAKIQVTPYGGFMPITGPTARGRGDRCGFLFIGQGTQRKGVHHLLAAWGKAKLARSTLTLVCRRGDPAVKDMAEAVGARFVPGLDKAELDAIYTDSDVFAMPSIHEGFGLVYLEAMAAGLFCIGTRNTGLPDMVTAPDSWVAVEAGDIEALVNALQAAEARWAAGGYDRAAIAAGVSRRTWADHRADLVAAVRRTETGL